MGAAGLVCDQRLGVGARVVLHNLKAEELNGLRGEIASVSATRAGVCITGSGRLLSVRYHNLAFDADHHSCLQSPDVIDICSPPDDPAAAASRGPADYRDDMRLGPLSPPSSA